jgi:hypothetical protein
MNLKQFVLTAYILLAFGALIYGNLITLNLDFTWQDNTLIAQVPRNINQATLFLEFKAPRTGAFPFKVVSGKTSLYEGQMLLEESSNFNNFTLFRKISEINEGPLELQFETPIDILEVRAEYRYSAFQYYWEALKTGEARGIALVFAWLIVFSAGILLWKFGLKISLLMVVTAGHLFFLWTVFAPLSGYDDTYH